MRINIFTAIPLGIYLHKVEKARNDGWEDTDKWIQDTGKLIYENLSCCSEKMNKSKFGSLENCHAAQDLLRWRASDLGLDLILFTMDACNWADRYKRYVKDYPKSKSKI